MQWTRPTWPIAFDMIAYGLAVLAMLVVACLWSVFGG